MLALLVVVVLGWVGNTQVHLSPQLLELLSGLAVPLVVAALTKLHASSAVKAVLNLVLSAIAGGLAVATTAKGDVVLSTWLLGMGQTFLYSIVSYYGLWKHTVAPVVAEATADVGLGVNDPSAGAPSSDDDILPAPVKKTAAKKTTAKKTSK